MGKVCEFFTSPTGGYLFKFVPGIIVFDFDFENVRFWFGSDARFVQGFYATL